MDIRAPKGFPKDAAEDVAGLATPLSVPSAVANALPLIARFPIPENNVLRRMMALGKLKKAVEVSTDKQIKFAKRYYSGRKHVPFTEVFTGKQPRVAPRELPEGTAGSYYLVSREAAFDPSKVVSKNNYRALITHEASHARTIPMVNTTAATAPWDVSNIEKIRKVFDDLERLKDDTFPKRYSGLSAIEVRPTMRRMFEKVLLDPPGNIDQNFIEVINNMLHLYNTKSPSKHFASGKEIMETTTIGKKFKDLFDRMLQMDATILDRVQQRM